MESIDLAEKLVKAFEGCRLEPYLDCAGLPTIGYGHLLKSLSALGPVISQDTADDLLEADLDRAARAVTSFVSAELDGAQLAALTDFTFNLGAGALQRSTLRLLLNRGDYAGAALEFPKWVKAGGVIVKGLVRRRLLEQKLFTSGQ